MKDIETANKTVLQRAEDYRQAAALIPAMNKVLEDFDGKVYNCRLGKALAAATNNRLHVEKRYSTIAVYTYPERNYSHAMTLAEMRIEDMPDGKRIAADKFRESSCKCREALLRKAYEIEIAAETMPQAIAYYEESVAKLNKFLQSFPTEFRDIYKLPYCVRTY